MSAYDRGDPRRSCYRKKAYPGEKAATQVAAKVMRDYPEADLVAYGCRQCGAWHIGQRPGSVRVER